MDIPLLIVFIGFLYIVVFGGLTLLRREALSIQFAVEALLITTISAGLAAFTSSSIHPAFFLIILYLVTMRTRWLVDLANMFAMRGQFQRSDFFYNLAERLLPDRSGRLIVQVNRATARLHSGAFDDAIAQLQTVLQSKEGGHLGVKYEAAAHYNLAVAYLKKGLDGQANFEFNAAIESWPASLYAQKAEAALSKNHRGS